MKIGSTVKTVTSFERMPLYGKMYPKLGEILTVSDIQPHPNPECLRCGMQLLSFEEKPDIPGICDRRFSGQLNFVEMLPPMTIDVEKIYEDVKRDRMLDLFTVNKKK